MGRTGRKSGGRDWRGREMVAVEWIDVSPEVRMLG